MKIKGSVVLGLIKANLATAWQSNGSFYSPSFLFHRRTAHVLSGKGLDSILQIVAHQVNDGSQEQMASMCLRRVPIDRVKRRIRRWNLEDEPASSNIDRGEGQYIAKEGAIRLRVARIKQYV